MGSKLGFLAGVLAGAAGAAAYFLWCDSRVETAAPGGFTQERAPRPEGDFSSVRPGEVARRAAELPGLQAAPAARSGEISGLSAQAAPLTDWQTRVPSLAALGQQLAHLPAAKQLAAERAVAAQVLPRVTAAPQDLASVAGIGATYEQRLYAAGIGSFWELASLSDGELAGILELTELQRAGFDGAAIRAQAEQLAAETGAVGQFWDGVAPDDLEPIKGIGKVFEQRLYDAGIRTYARLAAATPEELARICGSNLPVKPDFASWIEQARALQAQRA